MERVPIKRKSTHFVVLFLFVFSGVVFALIFGEACTRFIIHEAVNFYIYDQDVGFKRPPGARGWYTTEEFSTYISYNSEGYRDREWGREWNIPGKCRVLLLGDSIVEGIQVSENEHFATLLMHQHPELLVMNLATSAYGTLQEIRRGNKVLQDRGADVVALFFLGSNDLRNNERTLEEGTAPLERLTRPYLERIDGVWKVVGPADREHSPIAHPPLTSVVLRSSALVRFLHARISPLYKNLSHAHLAEEYPSDFDVFLPESKNRAWGKSWEATEELLRRWTRDTIASHAHPILFIAPYPELGDRNRWEEILKTYPDFAKQNPEPDLPNKKVMLIAQQIGVAYIDAAAEMYRRQNTQQYHFKKDGHLTPSGHQALMHAIEDRVLEMCGKRDK